MPLHSIASDMRLAAIASALAIVLCVAVFGAILQKAFVSGRAPLPAQAASTDGQAPQAAAKETAGLTRAGNRSSFE
jgi:hypothetical protein